MRAWRQASEESRRAIREIADDVFRRLKSSSRADNRQAIEDIRAAGLRIVPVSEPAMEVFREIGRRAARRNVETLYSEDLLERVQAAVAKYRAGTSDSGGDG